MNVKQNWLMICIVAMLVAVGMALTGCVSKLKSTTIKETFAADGKTLVERTTINKEESGWPLRKKATSVEQDARYFDLTTAVDPETGMIMPSIKYFGGNSAIDTMPMIENPSESGTNYSESLTIESSYWDDSVAFLKHRRKGAGSNIPASPIQYNFCWLS